MVEVDKWLWRGARGEGRGGGWEEEEMGRRKMG